MGLAVCSGAMLRCSFGTSLSILNVLPAKRFRSTMPIANIIDNTPFVNIMPFAMCTSLANPAVAAATAAVMGVLTPIPCVPVTSAPWAPGSPTFLIAGMPILNNSSRLMCTWGGIIDVISPGQFTIRVP